MATRGTRDGAGAAASLPRVVPLDLPHLGRLSWDLGTHVVDGERATLRGTWERDDSPWALSVFEVASETAVLRVRTPIGRERFYGAARMDLESALTRLDAAPRWRRVA